MPPTKKAPAKKAVARKAALKTVAPESETVEPVEDRTGRFFEIQQEVSAPKAYRLTQDIVLEPMTRRRLREYMATTDDEERGRILFGDHADAIEALYEDRPVSEWTAMLRDVWAFYFGQGATELPGGSQGS